MLKKILIWLFGIVAVLAVSLPLFHGTFFRTHDYVHAARIIEIVRGLQDGSFPVRWSANFGYGFGMPLFEFYAPLPYYTGALFYLLGLDVVTAIKLLFFLCSLLTFVGMYKLASRLFGKAGGILSAVALTLAPYRAVNLYVRGALSEAWGIMALPWVLLGVVQVIKKEKRGWLNLLFGLLVLFLSHNITTLIFIPLSIVFGAGYFAMQLFKSQTKKVPLLKKLTPILVLGTIYALGIGLAAFYIFPALSENSYTRVDQIFRGYFSYNNHFLYIRQFFVPNWGYGGSVWGPDDGLSFFLGYGQLLGLGLVLIWFGKSLLQKIRAMILKRKGIELLSEQSGPVFLPLLTLGLMLAAMFMTLLKSKPIWDALPFMVTIQFPWRWLSAVILFLALLVGMATLYIKQRFLRYLYVFILSTVIIIGNYSYFRPVGYLQNNNEFYYTDANTIRTNMSSILPDYIPKQMPEDFAPVPVGQVFLVPPNDAKVSVITDKVQIKKVDVVATQDTQLDFAIADYPGWTTFIDNHQVEKIVGKTGTITVAIPKGSHQVTVELLDTPIRQISDQVSLVCVILLLILLFALRMKQGKFV